MKRTLVTAALTLLAAAGAASAQNMKLLGEKGDWALYDYNDAKGKICYALTVPTDMKPATLDHGKRMFFVVTQTPAPNVGLEPQFRASYKFQTNSTVDVTVGERTFKMFTDEDGAWLIDPAEGPQLIAAMKAGTDMKVAAKSGRGNPTNYVFSLKGVTAAIQEIESCK